MRIGVVLPTNQPEIFTTHFLTTLPELLPIAEHLEILIEFQPPYTKSLTIDITNYIANLGFPVNFHFSTEPYLKPVSLFQIRNVCANLDPTVDAYFICDDDFKFRPGSARKYGHVIDYMARFPQCGVVLCKSYLGGYRLKDRITPISNSWLWTNRGLFIRNIHSKSGWLLAPDETLEIRGSAEDTVYAMARIENGYYAAKQMNNPTVHHAVRIDNVEDILHFCHRDVLENAFSYIRSRYHDPQWKYDNGIWPIGLVKMYHQNGGIDITNSDLIVDYGLSE